MLEYLLKMIEYMLNNLQLYAVVAATLFFWDLLDLYVFLGDWQFILRDTFVGYYMIRLFFCMVLLEAGFRVDLLSTTNRYVMAAVVPLSFSVILQNLVVKVGGVDSSINISAVFDQFKAAVRENLARKEAIDKVKKQNELLTDGTPTEDIRNWCIFLLTDSQFQELEKLVASISTEDGKKAVYIKTLVAVAGKDAIEEVRRKRRARQKLRRVT